MRPTSALTVLALTVIVLVFANLLVSPDATSAAADYCCEE